MKDLSFPEANLGPGRTGRILRVNGRLAYVDKDGRAFWLRPGPRIRGARDIEELRAVIAKLDAPRSSLIAPADSHRIVKAP